MGGNHNNHRNGADVKRWRNDPVSFIQEVLRNPEDGTPFVLYPKQKKFLRLAFKLNADGQLKFPELLFSAPKKSGKTALAAMCAIYAAVVLGGRYAEIYCLANDFEQASSRVFQAAARMVEASPLLRRSARITANKIEFRSTGSFIQACASDYAGFADANQRYPYVTNSGA
jgi:phage terminase large subunit-like protein